MGAIIKNVRGSNRKFRNMIAVKILIIRILEYSAIKIKAKVALLNSVLNPETNSDSPSAKSKGVRLVSARVVINQIKTIGIIINIGIDLRFEAYKFILNEQWIRITDKKIKAIEISYEIVWAILRNAPNKAYFEFEAHPAANVVYTLKLEIAKKRIAEYEDIQEGFR